MISGPEPKPPIDPCEENPEAEKCEPIVCLCPPGEGQDCPDIDCDPCIDDLSLPECEPSPDDDCDSSYPDTCIPSPPPDLDCDDVSSHNFKVTGSDPHGFDGDNDGIGCEGNGSGGGGNGGNNNNKECDPSYPEDCIPSPPPDLDCGDNDVPNNVKVLPPDPHRLDGDKDGVGCEGSGIDNGNNNDGNDDDEDSTFANECQGQADCFRGKVTVIVDGDTIDMNNVRIRLALVNIPERRKWLHRSNRFCRMCL